MSADDYVDQVAGELAVQALKDEYISGDEKIVAEIAEILGSSSQTLQEAYLTAVRVRRAEKRARELLDGRAQKYAPDKSRMIEDHSDEPIPRERGTVFERERAPDGTVKPEVEAETPPEPSKEPAAEPAKDSFEDTLAKNLADLADFASGKTDQAPAPDAPPASGISPSRPQRK